MLGETEWRWCRLRPRLILLSLSYCKRVLLLIVGNYGSGDQRKGQQNLSRCCWFTIRFVCGLLPVVSTYFSTAPVRLLPQRSPSSFPVLLTPVPPAQNASGCATLVAGVAANLAGNDRPFSGTLQLARLWRNEWCTVGKHQTTTVE